MPSRSTGPIRSKSHKWRILWVSSHDSPITVQSIAIRGATACRRARGAGVRSGGDRGPRCRKDIPASTELVKALPGGLTGIVIAHEVIEGVAVVGHLGG